MYTSLIRQDEFSNWEACFLNANREKGQEEEDAVGLSSACSMQLSLKISRSTDALPSRLHTMKVTERSPLKAVSPTVDVLLLLLTGVLYVFVPCGERMDSVYHATAHLRVGNPLF